MEKKHSLNKSDSIDYMEILSIRDELEKTIDLMKKKEREYELKNDEHQNDLKMKQKQINKLYNELNGGKLYDRIKMVKLPYDKDVCELRGEIDKYYVKIK